MQHFKEMALAWLSHDLKKAGIKKSAQKYFEDSLKFSVLAALFFWVLWSLLFEDMFLGFFGSIFFFSLNACFWMYYPAALKKRKAELVEKELPFALLNLSVELNADSRLVRAIKSLCAKNKNFFTKELEKAHSEITEGGLSAQRALLNIGERVESESLKRALMKIITIYEQGGEKKARVDSIRSIATQELAIQKAKSKEFSQKLVLYSIMFIVVSAVFPAMFLAFITVGSSFMRIGFLPSHIILIVTLVFPLLDIAALFFIRSRTPQFLR